MFEQAPRAVYGHLGHLTQFLALAAAAIPACDDRPSEETQRRAGDAAVNTLVDLAAKWSAGDLEGWLAGFAPDCSVISGSGVTAGAPLLKQRFGERYKDKSGMGSMTLTPLSRHVAVNGRGEGVVSVVAEWTLGKAGKPAASGHALIVLSGGPDDWSVMHDASISGSSK